MKSWLWIASWVRWYLYLLLWGRLLDDLSLFFSLLLAVFRVVDEESDSLAKLGVELKVIRRLFPHIDQALSTRQV